MGKSKLVLAGKVSGVFGTRGWVKLFSYTRPRSNLIDYKTLLLGRDHTPYQIAEAKKHGNRLIALFEDIESTEQARSLIDQEIFLERHWLAPEAEGEFYWADLIGLLVVNKDGIELGCVKTLHETGANDVLELDVEPPRLIPFVMDTYILSVNLDEGVITADWHPED